MKRFLMICLLISLLASCFSTAPHVAMDYTPSKKLDLNIALVTSGVSYEHHTEVSTRCIESSYNKAGYNVGRIADNGSMYAKNNIGEEIDQPTFNLEVQQKEKRLQLVF